MKHDPVITNCILTFEDGQQFIDLPLPLLDGKEPTRLFLLGAASALQAAKKRPASLVKVSMCVYHAPEGFGELPELAWYNECNGKFWQDELAHY